MCVAIYKPIGVEMPTKDELYNCYIRNKDGAGFAFYRNGKIHIKKGYMDFQVFYSELCKENFQSHENVFIHFRIATHGLVDGGNTHPFPITNNFETMRNTNTFYVGKCLIHNGIFHYSDALIKSYSKIISDTMLFSKLLFDEFEKDDNELINKHIDTLNLEESVKRGIIENNQENLDLIKKINSQLGHSKIAIMNEDGSVNFFGNWINHNGVFYSNNSYEGYKNYAFGLGYNNYYDSYDDKCNYSYRTTSFWNDIWGNKKGGKEHQYCSLCETFQKKCIYIDDMYVCKNCIKVYGYKFCTVCKTWFDESVMHDEYTCNYCYADKYAIDDYNDGETDICLCCGQNYIISSSKEKNICQKCFEEYSCY